MLELLTELRVFLRKNESASEAIFYIILRRKGVDENLIGDAKEYHDTLI